MKKEKIIVGLSGGVDSAVAASLLIKQNYDVEAVFMKNWDEDDEDGYCAAEQDLKDAASVADALNIKLHTVNFSSEYWDRVFEFFLQEYKAGRTPNPDILCNQEIKFRAFLDYALDLGAARIATGHYARISKKNNRHHLLTGVDDNKDQSYFLYRLSQRALRHSIFPLGELEKTKVRELAREAGFTNATKKDSTGICFIGERKFTEFLARYLPAEPGDIITIDKETIGKHNGLMFHTIGQRQGLGIGGLKQHSGDAWYVADKDLKNNQLIVVQGKQHPALFKPSLEISDLHWIDEAPAFPFRCTAQIRYRQTAQPCEVIVTSTSSCHATFESPQRAVTPGQAIVFYTDDHCLGGGTIYQ